MEATAVRRRVLPLFRGAGCFLPNLTATAPSGLSRCGEGPV
ncbi:hypothetical protein STVIR_8149 [Streptomyces viridochromogenes Tue57]|uniref:Uncharacterized protein n=1 Tax=Streptomyces viridochromogenes Tue57 TaxID=1160705 RepID=L8P3W1_STRVR|nr:hypothetical protein STVIR_8149 [Streptomyces viridochromogenes Tue57]